MKNTFFTFILLFSIISALAQENDEVSYGFSKKDVYLSGTLNYLSIDYGDSKSNSFEFSPAVGYFINESTSLELGVLVGANDNTNQQKTNTFGVEIKAVHFFSIESKFSFTFGGGLSYASVNFNNTNGGDFKVNAFGATLSPGVNYFVSNNIALRASLGAVTYRNEKGDFNGAEAVNSFNINLNLSNVNFGLLYKF